MTLEQRFLDALPLVEQIVACVAARHHLSAAEAEDFAGYVRMRLVENGYRAIASFEGRAQFRTYLTVIVSRMLVDFRATLYGAWRPSTAATRLGPTAVLLEELVSRDGLAFDEAVETMRTTHRVAETREALYDLLQALPVRPPVRRVAEDAAADVAATTGSPDEGLAREEHARRVERVEAALARALARLSVGERALLRLRFVNGLSVAQAARALHLEPRAAYRRFDRAVRKVRDVMLADGITAAEAADVLGHETAAVDDLLASHRWRRLAHRPAGS